ncbi:hypothetical protein ACH4E7_37005 [Kitasatospora sp. NPDC018058]
MHLVQLGWLPLLVWEHKGADTAVANVDEALAFQGHPRALGIQGGAAQ